MKSIDAAEKLKRMNERREKMYSRSNSVEAVEWLGRLAIAINDHFDQSEVLAAEIRTKGPEAVKERVLLGQSLRQAKGLVRHGQWYIWLKKHCPKLSVNTVERAMRLANPSHVMDLETCAGLREAYIACGILPESLPAEGEAMEPGAEMTIDKMARRVDWFRTRLSAAPLVNWSRDQKQRMASALRPLVELYEQLLPEAC